MLPANDRDLRSVHLGRSVPGNQPAAADAWVVDTSTVLEPIDVGWIPSEVTSRSAALADPTRWVDYALDDAGLAAARDAVPGMEGIG